MEMGADSGAGSALDDQGTPRGERWEGKLLGEDYFTPEDGVVQTAPIVGETDGGAHHSRVNFRSADREGASSDTPRDVAGYP